MKPITIKYKRTLWELFFMLVIVFPLLVYLSNLKFGNVILIWFTCILITPIAWWGLTYKTTGFWRMRGKIAWWMWLYFITGTAITKTLGMLMFFAVGNILVLLPFLPFLISVGIYDFLFRWGWKTYLCIGDYFHFQPNFIFNKWTLQASTQLYFIVIPILIVYGSILIAKWRYKPEDESEEENDCTMTK